MSSGQLANKSGKELEQEVAHLLRVLGFRELDAAEKKQLLDNAGRMPTLSTPWFAQQVRLYRTLYGSKHVTDFFVWHPNEPKGVLVEVKWQASPGSVDEKYVFTALSLKAMPPPAVLVLEGGGTRPAAIAWIRKQRKKGAFELMTYHTFERWINTLLAP